MDEMVVCKCGRPAIYNKDTEAWELCSDCRNKILSDNASISRCGFGVKYASASFSDFTDEFKRTLIKDTNLYKNNLLLSGASSVGKTHLMACIAKDLFGGNLHYNDIIYTNMIQMCLQIGSDITQMDGIIEKCSNCKYLFLDEVVPTKTQWEERMIYMILENRRNDCLTTISATNADVSKLDGRIVSRLLDNNGIQYTLTRKVWA